MAAQTPAPREVKRENLSRFILEKPAGREMSCLITGISLPMKVVISPCLEKNNSDLSIEFLFKKSIFPYLNTSLFTAALPR